jgi:hypothetical protein
MFRVVTLLLFLLLLLPISSHSQAQTSAGEPTPSLPLEVNAPELRTGDRWEYRRTDGFTKIVRGHTTFTVTDISSDQITITIQRRDGASWKSFVTRELNLLAIGEGDSRRRFTPYNPFFSFPLAPGKSWSGDVEFPNRSFAIVRSKKNGRVLGWERVEVPAGNFDALKLTVDGDYAFVRGRPYAKGQTTESCWYVPSVRRCVKYTFREVLFAYNESFIDELVRFELQR